MIFISSHDQYCKEVIDVQPYAFIDKPVSAESLEDINAIGEEYDTIIITVFNDQDRVTGPIHTMNVSKEQAGYVCHNSGEYTDTNGITIYSPSKPQDSLWKAIMDLSEGKAKPICIIGIDKK